MVNTEETGEAEEEGRGVWMVVAVPRGACLLGWAVGVVWEGICVVAAAVCLLGCFGLEVLIEIQLSR